MSAAGAALGRALRATLSEGAIRAEPLVEAHREPLRQACAADPAIWDIYSRSFAGEHFDPSFADLLDGPARQLLALFAGDRLVGMSGYIDVQPDHRALEIGYTYLVPEVRGTGLNRRFKALLLEHAFRCGFHRVQFKVDARNGRSQAALRKLGAVREGLLRQNMVTWTGHVRDSFIFSILSHEWPP